MLHTVIWFIANIKILVSSFKLNVSRILLHSFQPWLSFTLSVIVRATLTVYFFNLWPSRGITQLVHTFSKCVACYITLFLSLLWRYLWEHWAPCACVCPDITPPVHLSFLHFGWSCSFLRVDSIVWASSTYSISHSQTHTHTHTHLQMDAGLLRVCVSVCAGNVVPRISITGSRAGVSPHTKDAGRLEALGPNRGRDRRGKRKSASARSANSILTYISQSGK